MKYKVLVVDDTNFMRKMVADCLKQSGHEVVGEAANGKEAIRLFGELRPDIVMMDLTMPEMNGVDAIKEILKIDAEAVVLICSASHQQEMIFDALEAGAKGYVLKPFTPERLKEVIEKFADPHLSTAQAPAKPEVDDEEAELLAMIEAEEAEKRDAEVAAKHAATEESTKPVADTEADAVAAKPTAAAGTPAAGAQAAASPATQVATAAEAGTQAAASASASASVPVALGAAAASEAGAAAVAVAEPPAARADAQRADASAAAASAQSLAAVAPAQLAPFAAPAAASSQAAPFAAPVAAPAQAASFAAPVAAPAANMNRGKSWMSGFVVSYMCNWKEEANGETNCYNVICTESENKIMLEMSGNNNEKQSIQLTLDGFRQLSLWLENQLGNQAAAARG